MSQVSDFQWANHDLKFLLLILIEPTLFSLFTQQKIKLGEWAQAALYSVIILAARQRVWKIWEIFWSEEFPTFWISFTGEFAVKYIFSTIILPLCVEPFLFAICRLAKVFSIEVFKAQKKFNMSQVGINRRSWQNETSFVNTLLQKFRIEFSIQTSWILNFAGC